MLLVAIILTIVSLGALGASIAVLVSVLRTMRRVEQDQHMFSIRLDYLRTEMGRTQTKQDDTEEAVPSKKAPIPPLAPLPVLKYSDSDWNDDDGAMELNKDSATDEAKDEIPVIPTPEPPATNIGDNVLVAEPLSGKGTDSKLVVALMVIAGLSAMLAIPLTVQGEAITISLALFAFLLVWVGRKVRCNALQHLGYLAYVLTLFRVVSFDLAHNFSIHPHVGPDIASHLLGIVDRFATFGIVAISLLCGSYLQRNDLACFEQLTIAEQADTREWVPHDKAAGMMYWIAFYIIFGFVHLEMNGLLHYFEQVRLPTLTVLWISVGMYCARLYSQREGHSVPALCGMLFFLIGAAAKVATVDLWSWSICRGLIYNMEYTPLYAGIRALDFGLLLVAYLSAWRILRADEYTSDIAAAFGYLGLGVVFIYSSLELNTFLFWTHEWLQAVGLSALWLLFGILSIAGGARFGARLLQHTGVILCALALAKTALLDLDNQPLLYRLLGLGATWAGLTALWRGLPGRTPDAHSQR